MKHFFICFAFFVIGIIGANAQTSYMDRQILFGFGMNIGGVGHNGNGSADLGVYLNLYGVTFDYELGLSGGSKGENKYGKGDVAEKPVINEMLFGYSIPVVGFHEKSLLVTPVCGFVKSDYQYEDDYYGKAETAYSESEFSYGGIITIKGSKGFLVSLKATNHGGSFGLGYSF